MYRDKLGKSLDQLLKCPFQLKNDTIKIYPQFWVKWKISGSTSLSGPDYPVSNYGDYAGTDTLIIINCGNYYVSHSKVVINN